MTYAALFPSKKITQILRKVFPDYSFLMICESPTKWFTSSKFSNTLYCSTYYAIQEYKKGNIKSFLIFPSKTINTAHIVSELEVNGVLSEHILYLSHTNICNGPPYQFSPYKNSDELFSLSVHVSACCNLNCTHCSSMCGLQTNHKEIDLNTTFKSIQMLNQLFKSIINIQIIGGEPLLCPELLNFLHAVRNCYPLSKIEIVTNGTLLLQQEAVFYERLSQDNISISISYYPVLSNNIDEINDLLKSKKIDYSISDKIKHFYKLYNLSGNSEPLSTYYSCQSIQYCKNELTLLENYLYPCVAPIALERAGLILSCQYGINLMSNVTKNDIIQLSCTPIDICRFCHMDYQKRWHQLDEREIDSVKNWSVM